MSGVSKQGPREYVGYVRVSQVRGRDSEENRDRFHSPDMQLDRIKDAIERVDGTYVDFKYDPDKSGYQKHVVREGWNEAVAWVMADPTRRGIVAYDTSRLSRNLWRLLGDVQHTLVPAGARVVVAGEGIDTATPNWQMALQMAGIMAEQFSRKIGERWQEVHQRRMKRKQHPIGRVPYGYRRMAERLDPDTGAALPSLGIEPDPETAPVVRRMYRMYLDGHGLRGIAQALNAEGVASPKGAGWSTTSMARILKNPASVGEFVFRGEVVEGGWEPLVDRGTWDAFQRMQASKKRLPNRQQSTGWTLAGVAVCAKCGGRLTVNYLPQEADEADFDARVPVPKSLAKRRGLGEGATWSVAEQKAYRNSVSTAMCTTYRTKGRDRASGGCEGVFMARAALETQFAFFLGTMLEEVGRGVVGKASEARESARADAARRAEEARAELERCSASRTNLALLRADGDVDEAEYRAALRRVNARADEARAALEAAENGVSAAEPLSDVWKQLEEGGEGMSPQAWNLVLRRVMQRVEVGDKSLLFVPTLGEPVEWGRKNLSRGSAARRANYAKKRDAAASAASAGQVA